MRNGVVKSTLRVERDGQRSAEEFKLCPVRRRSRVEVDVLEISFRRHDRARAFLLLPVDGSSSAPTRVRQRGAYRALFLPPRSRVFARRQRRE